MGGGAARRTIRRCCCVCWFMATPGLIFFASQKGKKLALPEGGITCQAWDYWGQTKLSARTGSIQSSVASEQMGCICTKQEQKHPGAPTRRHVQFYMRHVTLAHAFSVIPAPQFVWRSQENNRQNLASDRVHPTLPSVLSVISPLCNLYPIATCLPTA
jgi:hypothetical protein